MVLASDRYLAQSHFDAGRLAMAEASFSAALKLDPLNGKAQRGLTRVQARSMSEQGAAVDRTNAVNLAMRLEAAEKADAEYATQYRLALGGLYQASGDLQSAESWYAKAVQGDPNNGSAWRAQGVLLSVRGQIERSIASFKKAIDLDADDSRAQFLLGRLYKSQRKLALAKPLLQTSAEKLGDLRSWYELGDAYLQSGDVEQAFAALTRAASLNGGNALPPDLSAAVGVSAYRTKRYSEAVKWLQDANKTSKDPAVRLNYAVALQAIGNHSQAISLLNQILRDDALNVDANIQLMVSLAKTQQGRLAHQVGNRFLTLAVNIPSLASGADRVRKALANIPMGSMSAPARGLITPGE